ncbi:endonuclease [Polymorphobacter glacialis]|uniref:Endonuclease n=1 Tax=Sandarakinorhabdus glacialis TaxID=1614636 RepID=A0A916ZMW1_9SPHN|nr:endonuclease/exonuclease/phosphatase family protein [Polymorphobacter glacialis]GGE05514.1 endonuclease [Polymorphobacter glacialis]
MTVLQPTRNRPLAHPEKPSFAQLPANRAVSVGIASYNIQKAIGTDMRRMPTRTLAVIDEIGADIIVLQEADRRFGSRLSALPLPLLAAHHWHPVQFETRAASIGWHGNAILVSSRVEVVRHAVLRIPALEPRGAVLADLRVDGALLRVVGMHLDLSGLWRRRQARAIIAHVAAQPGNPPTLLMGDLNEWRVSAGAIADFSRNYSVIPTGPSFHARMPIAALDRIFVSGDLALEGAGVHHSVRSVVASDHLPIWVRLGLNID